MHRPAILVIALVVGLGSIATSEPRQRETSLVHVYRELMAFQLAKLLRGAKPAELPVLQPAAFGRD